MPASLDCILCLSRQSLEAARLATDDETKHAAVLKQALQLVQKKGFTTIPPLVAQDIQRIIRRETGSDDPYIVQKQQANELMLSVRDSLRQRIRQSEQPLETAVQLAIAGNSVDCALRSDWNEELILNTVKTAMKQPLNGNINEFIQFVSNAKKMLYLLDNCGEIVCDQLLIEEIQRTFPALQITAVVRGMPVLNDATKKEAEQIGLPLTVPVIDNGNDAVGTILEQCGAEFQEHLRNADSILSKGLANYETLVEYDSAKVPQAVCYLFKAKCPFIARFAGVGLGDAVLRLSGRA
jgi:uncharacterized protein with ATP-grasp and redox domains